MTDFQEGRGNSSDQTIIVTQARNTSNSIGVAGFVLSLIAFFLGWIPILGWLLWLLGLVFSFAGVFKEPRGLAIAGLVISLLGIIILFMILLFFGATSALFSFPHIF